MNLSKKIIRGMLAFSSGTLILTFINFATAILVIRWLGIEDYGQLVLALSIYAIASTFLDPGIGGLVISEVAKGRGDQQFGRVKLFLIRYGQMELGLGLFLFLAMLFASSFLEVFISKEITLIVGIYLFFTAIKNVCTTFFHSHTLYHYQVLLQVIQSTGRLILVIFFLGWLKWGLLGAMITYPLSITVAVIFLFPVLLKSFSYLEKTEIKKEAIFSSILKDQGKFVVLLAPAKKIQDQIPLWILRGIVGFEAVAVYGVAQKVSAFLFSFYQSLETTIFPLTSEMALSQWGKVKKMVGKSIKYSLWLSILIVPVVWLMAPFLFELAFSEKYITSVPIFRLFLLSLFIYSFGLVQRPLFFALGALKYHFYIYVVSTLLYSFNLWLFISQIGIIGAVWALIVNGIIICLVRFYYLKKIKPDLRINIRGLFYFDAFDKEMLNRVYRVVSQKVGSLL